MKAIVDTNILIDYLNGIQQAQQELDLYEEPCISLITWMEVLTGSQPEEEDTIREFLIRFRVIPIDKRIAEEAVRIRRERRLRLPDAIICLRRRLVTRAQSWSPETPGTFLTTSPVFVSPTGSDAFRFPKRTLTASEKVGSSGSRLRVPPAGQDRGFLRCLCNGTGSTPVA